MSPLHPTSLEASQYISDYVSFNLPEWDILQGNSTVMDVSQCFLGNTPRDLSANLSPYPNNMSAGFAFNDSSQFQIIENLHSQNIFGPTRQNIDCISSIYEVDEHTTDGGIERTSTHPVHEECKSDSAVASSTEVSSCSNVKSRNRLCLGDGAKR